MAQQYVIVPVEPKKMQLLTLGLIAAGGVRDVTREKLKECYAALLAESFPLPRTCDELIDFLHKHKVDFGPQREEPATPCLF